MRYWAWQARPTRPTSLVRACMLGLLFFFIAHGTNNPPQFVFLKIKSDNVSSDLSISQLL